MLLILYGIENKDADDAFRPILLFASSIPGRKTRIKTKYSRLSSYFFESTTKKNRIGFLISLILSYSRGWKRGNGGAQCTRSGLAGFGRRAFALPPRRAVPEIRGCPFWADGLPRFAPRRAVPEIGVCLFWQKGSRASRPGARCP